MQAMMCADGLVTARSTLGFLVSYHTTANVVYGPTRCDSNLHQLADIRNDVLVSTRVFEYDVSLPTMLGREYIYDGSETRTITT